MGRKAKASQSFGVFSEFPLNNMAEAEKKQSRRTHSQSPLHLPSTGGTIPGPWRGTLIPSVTSVTYFGVLDNIFGFQLNFVLMFKNILFFLFQ